MITSVYWYQKATSSGNFTANLYLANCYRLGNGVEKDEIKAFEYYETLAKREIADAQYQLGNCFHYGIGTKMDKIQAKCWYEKATKNGSMIAKDILKIYYNKTRDIKFQKLLNFKRLSKFGLNYFGAKSIKNDQDIDLVVKLTVDEGEIKPFDLKNFYKKEKGVRKDGRKAFEFH